MKRVKLLVIDWDGTLADSVSQIVACKTFLAKKYHLPIPSEATIRRVLGRKFEIALATCFPNVSSLRLRMLAEEFHHLMQQETYQARLFPNVKEILQLCKKNGIKLAVATSKDRKELDKAIAYSHLEGIFDITCCGKEYKEKPDPAMLKRILTQLKVDPSECLMIGDTTTDIQFARNAGVNTICVTFGAHSLNELNAEKPLAFIADWKELPEVINNLCYSYRNSY